MDRLTKGYVSLQDKIKKEFKVYGLTVQKIEFFGYDWHIKVKGEQFTVGGRDIYDEKRVVKTSLRHLKDMGLYNG